MRANPKELLTKSFSDYKDLPKAVQDKMAQAVLCGAQIMELPEGKRIVFPEKGGSSEDRRFYVWRWGTKDRETFDAMPWGYFEESDEKRGILTHRIGLRVLSKEEVRTGRSGAGWRIKKYNWKQKP